MHFTTKAAAALAVAGSLPQAFGHYVFDRLILNGAQTGQWEYVRKLADSQSNSPILDVTSNDIRCNNGGLASGPNTKTAPVAAGDTVGFTVNSIMGHPGPLTVYMSKATGDVSAYQGDGDWFKIYDAGVKTFATDGQSLTWITDGVTQVSFPLPTAIENGQYLLRVEHIATHGAGTVGGAQFYISCAQIEVTGGSGGSPSPVGKFPGIYTATDPGIQFEPYWPPVTAYTLPGLAVYGGGASGNADGSGSASGSAGGSAGGNTGGGAGGSSGGGSSTTTAVPSVTRAATTLSSVAAASGGVSSPATTVPAAPAAPGTTGSCPAGKRRRRRSL